eukprot:TRINITY_DN3265_c0_g1_i1.p1 TRINITY_DN3265_c0_g1~~TRINITY_DN3265_c0_g1_i1.p1  ORF type:complete len:400 (+),score=79.49 TRINITY_DN3265_c0_g1_i1:17-1216(+)
MRSVYLIYLCALIILVSANPTLLAEWVYLDYDWQTPEQRSQYIINGKYIIENNVMAGIKLYKGEIYVTVPRWREGVPSTLNKLITKNNMTILQPYPSWDMQQIGNYSALQYVQSMEIDSRGWMWILDVGRLNIFGSPDQIVNGPAKLVIWSIIENCLIREFVLPNSVSPFDGSFLNDIVVDETAGFAYMTDTWGDGGIVVYDFNTNQARRWDDPTLKGNKSAIIVINGKSYNNDSPSDGIALSHDGSLLFYCALSRKELYGIPTKPLKDFSTSYNNISHQIIDFGAKGYSDGMAFSDNENLYFGSLEQSAIFEYNPLEPLSNMKMIAMDPLFSQWPDTFAFDGLGNLIWVSNKLQKFFYGEMVFDGSDGANFRIWSLFIQGGSYLSGNPIPPYLPCSLS